MTKRVLVVDDDESIRETVQMALADEGYDVRTASDGRVALEQALAWQPNIILLDMKMPVMDGWGFAEEYRRFPNPRAPVVVLTAARDASEWAAQIRATSVLPKPFDLDELFDTIDQYIA